MGGIGQTLGEVAGLISFISLGLSSLSFIVVFISKVDVPEWSLVGVRAGDVTVNFRFISDQEGEAGERGGTRRLTHEPVVYRLTLSLQCFVSMAPRLLCVRVHHLGLGRWMMGVTS